MTALRFRIWHPVEQTMTVESLTRYMSSRGILDQTVGCDEGVWMQSTGLTDRNGLEVFEGDIVTFQNQHMPKPEVQGVVRWDELRLCWSFARVLDPRNLGMLMCEAMDNGVCDGDKLEVIGDVYRNPDLLSAAHPARCPIHSFVPPDVCGCDKRLASD